MDEFDPSKSLETKPITIPKFLLDILLDHRSEETEDMRRIRTEDSYKELLKFAKFLKTNNSSKNEIMLAVWMRNQERCTTALTESAVTEIVTRALSEFGHSIDLPDYEVRKIGKWKFVPGDLRIYYEDRLVYKISIHQWWVFDILIQRYRTNPRAPGIAGREVVIYLNEKLKKNGKEKSSIYLRDWAFNTGNSGSNAYTNLIGVSAGRDGDVYLNIGWVPDEKDFLNPTK